GPLLLERSRPVTRPLGLDRQEATSLQREEISRPFGAKADEPAIDRQGAGVIAPGEEARQLQVIQQYPQQTRFRRFLDAHGEPHRPSISPSSSVTTRSMSESAAAASGKGKLPHSPHQSVALTPGQSAGVGDPGGGAYRRHWPDLVLPW